MSRWLAVLRDFAQRSEAPTWALVMLIYGGWLALTYWWQDLPISLVLPAGAWLCAWHMSLQHEIMHGHPTRNARINGVLAWPPLNLWLPFALYRQQHLRHHRAEHLTDPLDDPESTFMSSAQWAEASRARRWMHNACNTFLGRLMLGPAYAITAFWREQAGRGYTDMTRRGWLGHAIGVGAVLGWVCGICRIPPAAYAACFIYPGTALILLRSLAEHRAAMLPEGRTAIVERAGLLGLLFLNNNLHVLHHTHPSTAWYALPGQWRRLRPELVASCRCPIYNGYRDVALRYALRPQHFGPHPFPSQN